MRVFTWVTFLAVVCWASWLSTVNAQTPAVTASDNPWAHEFAEARAQATTARQQSILADEQITQAEYDELKRAWASCMADGGFPGTLAPDPLIPGAFTHTVHFNALPPRATPMSEDELFAAYNARDEQCSAIMGPIEALYLQTVVNPNHEDMSDLTFQCAHRNKLIPDGMTPDQFDAADTSGTWPDEVNIFTDEFATCFVNPLEIPVNPSATPIGS